MNRITRRTFVAGLGAAATLSPAFAQEGDGGGGLMTGVEPCAVDAKPITAFETGAPTRTQFGRLTFRGGLELTSSSKHFGGYSGLVMEPDGSGLLAVSDVGTWLSADLTSAGAAPAGLANAQIGPLLDGQGAPLARKDLQDAEALALIEGTLRDGTILVGFEREHRIVRYRVTDRKLVSAAGPGLKLPADASAFASNSSFEAVAQVKGGPHDGAVVAFAERYTPEAGYHTGWLWVAGEPKRFYLKDIGGLDITDAAGLGDGRLLVLERRYRRREGVQMRLRLLKAAEVAPDAHGEGEVLLRAHGDTHQIDNMEGLGVSRDAAGKTIITLISDDNFNHPAQRTVLVQFELAASAS